MKKDIPFSERLMQMLAAYDRMTALLKKYETTICNNEEDKKLPLILPELTEEQQSRELAARSMVQISHLDGDDLPQAGIVCASVDVISLAEQLNEAKLMFQSTVKNVRDFAGDNKTRLDRLIERVLKKEGRRTEQLERALQYANLRRLDLLRCYAQIRILPPKLRSLSWTWAKKHAVIMPIEMKEAIEMAKKLPSDQSRDYALAQLSRLASGQVLAYKKPLPNQLRANLVYREDEQIKRKAVTISGIVLSQDTALPRYIWRDNPGEQPENRLERTDVSIAPEPYIEPLRLHLYTRGPHAAKR